MSLLTQIIHNVTDVLTDVLTDIYELLLSRPKMPPLSELPELHYLRPGTCPNCQEECMEFMHMHSGVYFCTPKNTGIP